MKFIITILCIVFSQLSFSQIRVEDIKNDGDVTRFVNKNYNPVGISEWRDVGYCSELDTTLKYNPALKHFYDSVNAGLTWFTIDINKDGKLDLALCGCFGDYNLALIILSDKEGYKTVNLSKGNYDYSPQLLHKYGDSILVFESIRDADIYNNTGKFVIVADTIQFSENNLTELNLTKSHKRVDHVLIARTGFKTMAKSLAIDKKGNMLITLDDWEHGGRVVNKYTIPKSSMIGKSILQIAEGLPYYKYSSSYECDVNDGYSWDTEIYFSDGTNMKISDHMGVGPFGLRSIYDYVYKVFHDANRKLVATKKV